MDKIEQHILEFTSLHSEIFKTILKIAEKHKENPDKFIGAIEKIVVPEDQKRPYFYLSEIYYMIPRTSGWY